MINYNKLSSLPALIRSFCYNNEGWIVGGAAKYYLDLQEELPRDYDILIPFYQWGNACRSIPEGSVSNSFGGIKIVNEGLNIDIWCGDIGFFLGQVPNYPAYTLNPKLRIELLANNQFKRIKN